MKKLFFLITLILCLAMPLTVFAEITPATMPNQKEYTVLFANTAPTIDGVISEGEYGDALAVYNYNDGLTRNGDIATPVEMKELVASDWTIYFTYDKEYLYFACTYIDTDFDSEADTEGYAIWNGDSLEIDFWKYTENWDEYKPTDKVRFILGLAKDGSYWGGWAAKASYTTGDVTVRSELVGGKDRYAVSQNENLYTYEVKLTWQEVVGSDGPVDDVFFYAQLATDSVKYNKLGDGAVFWWRNVIPFSEGELAEVKAVGGESVLSYEIPILHFSEEALPSFETTTPEAPDTAVDTTPSDDTADVEIEPEDKNEAVDDLSKPDDSPSEPLGEAPEDFKTTGNADTGCGASSIGALGILAASLALAFVVKKKED